MAHIRPIVRKTQPKGSITVIDSVVPFTVKRVFYIDGVVGERGGHAHKLTDQFLTCVQGSCCVEIIEANGVTEIVLLDSPEKGALVSATEWHRMFNFTKNAILLVLASHGYDPDDYITEKPTP